MDLHIEHSHSEGLFFVELDGHFCRLVYSMDTPEVMNITSTYTPPELRGQSIAAKLTQHALDFCRDSNFKVIPTCPYVSVYIEKNPQYKDLLAI